MKYPKIRELIEAIKALVMGPYTSGFPKKDIEAFKEYRGKPKRIDEKCLICEGCYNVCPTDALKIEVDVENKKKRIIYNLGECIFCSQCVALCTTGDALEQTNEYELSYFTPEEGKSTLEKDLVVCEKCGAPIATKEHIVFMSEKGNELSYANPYSVMINNLINRNIPEDTMTDNGKTGDYLRITCPKCRREIIFKEQL